MTTISIADMKCGGCAKTVAAIVARAIPGGPVRIDRERRDVMVDDGDATTVIAALRAGGWDAQSARH